MKNVMFGITANPPHYGHQQAIEFLINLNFDNIFVNLSYSHPFAKKGIIDYRHRHQMLKILIKKINNKKVKLVEWDKEFYRQKNAIPYTIDLLTWLANQGMNISDLSLAFGEDNLKPDTWQKFKEYQKLANFNLIAIKDTGIHSSDIRLMLKNQQNTENLLPSKIINYIKTNKIY